MERSHSLSILALVDGAPRYANAIAAQRTDLHQVRAREQVEVNRELELHAALLGRDDGLELYGFKEVLERDLFLRLQSASGIGPRLALTLLGSMSAPQLVEAIRGRDVGRLQMVSGVGKKKAERITVELADKLDDMVAASVAAEPESALVDSAVSALIALGYARTEAESAVRRVLRDRDGAEHAVESLVKEALTVLS